MPRVSWVPVFAIVRVGRNLAVRARPGNCTQVDKHLVVLHSFIKKTPATPGKELKISRQRMKEVKNG
jgi:phage-related protein